VATERVFAKREGAVIFPEVPSGGMVGETPACEGPPQSGVTPMGREGQEWKKVPREKPGGRPGGKKRVGTWLKSSGGPASTRGPIREKK